MSKVSGGSVKSAPPGNKDPGVKKGQKVSLTRAQALLITHQQDEELLTFMNRAQKVIEQANISSLSLDQISILFQINMLTNEMLIRKIHENFDQIFWLPYNQAMRKVSSIHEILLSDKNIHYTGKGTHQRK